MSSTRWVGLDPKTLMEPLFVGTMARSEVTAPSMAFSVETNGRVVPCGHSVRKPSPLGGTTVAFSTNDCAEMGAPQPLVTVFTSMAPLKGGDPGGLRVSSFRAGVDVITVDDVPMKIYSPEKTITDCFKYRNKIGLDIAIEALRAYRERTRKPNRAALTKFAQINRVQKVMRPYLEAVV